MPTITFHGISYYLASGFLSPAELDLARDPGDTTILETTDSGQVLLHLAGAPRNVYLMGGASDDVLVDDGFLSHVVLDGGPGADLMVGGPHDIYIVDNSNDIVLDESAFPSSTIYSSVSYALPDNVNKIFLTGNGNFDALGNSASDIMGGNAGNNTLDGGFGPDKMFGRQGNDVYIVDNVGDQVIEHRGNGTDLIETTVDYTLPDHVENITILAGQGSSATGNTRDNIIMGNTGANALSGLAGNDTIEGGAGKDILNGGLGRDHLTGGADADIFKYDTIADSTAAAAGRDVIVDFHSSEHDRIDLSVIADTTLTGGQHFSFVGTNHFSHVAGELRYSVHADGVAVQGDVNGDGVADFAITVLGVTHLAASDFIL